MIATLGTLSILTALGASFAVAVQGFRHRSDGDRRAVRTPVLVLAGAALAAFVFLELGILVHDFSIAYVANNTATTTPFVFLFAAGWAALEGSIVLWGLVLAAFVALVWLRLSDRDPLGVLALGVMGLVAIFWFGLMATAGNPFSVCTSVVGEVCSASSWWPLSEAVAPADGRGPNPLLQNHILMAVHPPMLYVGYVGLTVPFAFAISALILGETGRTWLDRTHRWSLIAWIFLTFGIVLGGWWSYEVLGWGGYWAWDPVENAALLPWLTATAFIHSAIVQRKRGMLQAWNFLLVIATFAFTIFGTFLTRSGVIASVHAFTQSSVGPALLVFLAVVVVGSLALFAFRARDIAQAPRLDSLSSREGFILANNLILTVLTVAVLFGTIFPLLVQAGSGSEVSVGRPFYDRAAVPIALLLLLFIGLGAVAPWRVAKADVLWRRLRWPMVVGLGAGAVVVIGGVRSWPVTLAISLAFFVIAAIVERFISVVSNRPERVDVAARKVVRNDAGYWGGQLAHVGVALMAISLATTSGLAIRDTVTVERGSAATVGGYCIEYLEPFTRSEPNREVTGVRVAVLDESCTDIEAVLEPRLNAYPAAGQPIGTPDVWTGLVDDVYIGIAGGTTTSVALNVFVFPFQWLLWVGGVVIVAGGTLALFRKPGREQTASNQGREPSISEVH
ncbi:MAG: cytochrome c-type biogenesis CcmF C-terminal domain-containing protein [Acidimicrobiia bacterium]|nr:cytochrome c-type biogenesis CcmF C-terminal domain-containing protein [Acidimicrobiia bacterium]